MLEIAYFIIAPIVFVACMKWVKHQNQKARRYNPEFPYETTDIFAAIIFSIMWPIAVVITLLCGIIYYVIELLTEVANRWL